MDNLKTVFCKQLLPVLAAICLFITCGPQQVKAQTSYDLLPAPDVWYNSVDGIRLGLRVRGQQTGSFKDGAHRLNTGIWLATKFPGNPVSYYLSFTEPVPSISDFGSEASIGVESSYRTGFQNHGIIFDKRWQPGFDEMNYRALSIGIRAEHRFDEDYLLYPQLWQDEWLYLTSLNFLLADENAQGRYLLSASLDANLGGEYEEFYRSELSFRQQMVLNSSFTLHGRLYTGLASEQTAPEYLFTHSFSSARSWMSKGLTRARGTIPPSWMEAGHIQVTGGANLRGYLSNDIQTLNRGGVPLFTSLSALNLELDYPNPLDRSIDNIEVLGELADLRSYAFFDAGTSLGITEWEENRTLSDAGLGFLLSINIPDYLGKSRGLMLRYDIPLWLSHPQNENSFKFRSVIGIGAVISL